MSTAAARTTVRAAEGAIAFTDISGFSEFTALEGDEAALVLLSTQERVLRRELRHGARVVKNLGDGFLLWFPDACQAIETCLTLQDRFEAQLMDEDMPLWVRIGVHFGKPIHHRGDLVGHDVNVAARIVDLASPGEVLVSEATTAAMKHDIPRVSFEEVGPVVMKGIPESITLFRALRA